MAHKVFVVHGMGTFDAEWVDPVAKGLEDIYGQRDADGKLRYPLLAGLNFATRFEIVPIRYSDIFSEILERWKRDPGELQTDVVANDAEPSFYTSLTDELHNAAEQDSFFWSHAFDVLLYRYSPWVRRQVTTRVALQLARGIDAVAGSHGNWSAIAHSLGTMILHDSLHRLFVGELPEGAPTGFDATQTQSKAIVMVSNVSRALQTTPKVLSPESTIRPGYGGQLARGCRRYLTIRNPLDPFTWIKTFNPILWPDQETVGARRYQPIVVEHVQERNTHDLLHYLRNPEVHVPLFRALDHDFVITDEQAARSLDEFEYYGTFSKAELVGIRQAIEDLRNLKGFDNTWKAFRVLRTAWEELQTSWGHLLENGDSVDGPADDGNGGMDT